MKEQLPINIISYRTALSLNSEGIIPKEEVARNLIQILRSKQGIGEELRNAMADSLERGLTPDSKGVSLTISGSSNEFYSINRYHTLKTHLVVLAQYKQYRQEGHETANAWKKIKVAFPHLTSRESYLKDARKTAAEFRRWLQNRTGGADDIPIGEGSECNFASCEETKFCRFRCDFRAAAEAIFCQKESGLK